MNHPSSRSCVPPDDPSTLEEHSKRGAQTSRTPSVSKLSTSSLKASKKRTSQTTSSKEPERKKSNSTPVPIAASPSPKVSISTPRIAPSPEKDNEEQPKAAVPTPPTIRARSALSTPLQTTKPAESAQVVKTNLKSPESIPSATPSSVSKSAIKEQSARQESLNAKEEKKDKEMESPILKSRSRRLSVVSPKKRVSISAARLFSTISPSTRVEQMDSPTVIFRTGYAKKHPIHALLLFFIIFIIVLFIVLFASFVNSDEQSNGNHALPPDMDSNCAYIYSYFNIRITLKEAVDHCKRLKPSGRIINRTDIECLRGFWNLPNDTLSVAVWIHEDTQASQAVYKLGNVICAVERQRKTGCQRALWIDMSKRYSLAEAKAHCESISSLLPSHKSVVDKICYEQLFKTEKTDVKLWMAESMSSKLQTPCGFSTSHKCHFQEALPLMCIRNSNKKKPDVEVWSKIGAAEEYDFWAGNYLVVANGFANYAIGRKLCERRSLLVIEGVSDSDILDIQKKVNESTERLPIYMWHQSNADTSVESNKCSRVFVNFKEKKVVTESVDCVYETAWTICQIDQNCPIVVSYFTVPMEIEKAKDICEKLGSTARLLKESESKCLEYRWMIPNAHFSSNMWHEEHGADEVGIKEFACALPRQDSVSGCNRGFWYETKMTFKDAHEFCHVIGASLPSPRDAISAACVRQIIPDSKTWLQLPTDEKNNYPDQMYASDTLQCTLETPGGCNKFETYDIICMREEGPLKKMDVEMARRLKVMRFMLSIEDTSYILATDDKARRSDAMEICKTRNLNMLSVGSKKQIWKIVDEFERSQYIRIHRIWISNDVVEKNSFILLNHTKRTIAIKPEYSGATAWTICQGKVRGLSAQEAPVKPINEGSRSESAQ